jgi:hypothetical protein
MYIDTMSISSLLALLIAIVIAGALAILAGYLSFTMLRSVQAPSIKQPRFYLPSDFFVTLALLGNFWLVLLVLLGSEELLLADRPLIVIMTSLIAPFLSWWRKKKAARE